MTETVAVLVFPLAGALLLAAIGQRAWASRVNVAVSLLTWLSQFWPPWRGSCRCSSPAGFSLSIPSMCFWSRLRRSWASRRRSSRARTCRSSRTTAASRRRGSGSTTACIRCSTSRCCWRYSPTTWASCGSRWKLRRSPPCYWCRSTARRRAWKPRGSISYSAASASRRRCSAPSCSILRPRSSWVPGVARCCGPSSTA